MLCLIQGRLYDTAQLKNLEFFKECPLNCIKYRLEIYTIFQCISFSEPNDWEYNSSLVLIILLWWKIKYVIRSTVASKSANKNGTSQALLLRENPAAFLFENGTALETGYFSSTA